MKKTLKYIIPVLAITPLTGCDNQSGGNQEQIDTVYGSELVLPTQNDYTEYDFPNAASSNHFNNVAQYANMQSYMGWYYCYGSTDDNELHYMTYDPFAGKYRSPSELEAYIQMDEWQPSTEHEIMCCFKAPKAGTIDLVVTATLIYVQSTGDDGISLYCLKSTAASSAFASAYLTETNNNKTITTSFSVHKDEVLYFVMSPNENRWNDITRVNIDVTYRE